MNYRHGFHAGNFADCMKHALLVWLVRAMQRKEAGFLVLDTHAGTGAYDLAAEAATRTGEWRDGIGKLLVAPPAALADYVGLVKAYGWYPGSPALVRTLLRSQDRLACCELHREDVASLRRRFARDRQVDVHHRDGWEALGALLPPRERRGLILIDPPYEAEDEISRVVAGLRLGLKRFASGVFAVWYPIKHRAPLRPLQAALRDLRDVVTAELWLRPPFDPARLNGCGLAVVNPPFGFEAAAAPVLAALAERLGDVEAGCAVERLADE